MKQFYIYVHCKPNGDPFYIGKGHLCRTREINHGRNQHHKNVVSKYGVENIKIFILECDNEMQAFNHEVWLIAYGRAHGWPLVNQTDGGEGASGAIRTAASIAQSSMARTGQKRSAESCMKMSLAQLGKKLSSESIAKRSAKVIGTKRSLETRAKMSAAQIGKKHTTEAKLKMSLAKTGMHWTAAQRMARC